MKPVRTPDSDVTLTLPGGTDENDLPAQRIMVYNADLGETEQDARLAFESLWMPSVDEARRIEAGAAICLRITGQQHPPVSLSVTKAVVPERELIDRAHVDRALGHLYGQLKAELRVSLDRLDGEGVVDQRVDVDHLLPAPASFADLWATAVTATRPDQPEDSTDLSDPPASSNGTPAA